MNKIFNIFFPKKISSRLDEEPDEISPWFAMSLTIFFVAVLSLNMWFTTSTVSGQSMYPTLYDKDLLIGQKVDEASDIERGDIIILHKDDFLEGEHLVKRVVGKPGDTIEIKDSVVYINDAPLDESYLAKGTVTESFEGRFLIPNDNFFVMGDNRENSADSRYFGYVSIDECDSVVVKDVSKSMLK